VRPCTVPVAAANREKRKETTKKKKKNQPPADQNRDEEKGGRPSSNRVGASLLVSITEGWFHLFRIGQQAAKIVRMATTTTMFEGSGAAVEAGVVTAMQQRLQWKPVEGAVFRQMKEFNSLLNVFSLKTGKQYQRMPASVPEKERKEANFMCGECRKGCIRLQIQRQNQRVSWWIVRQVESCKCGVPSPVVEDLKAGDTTVLKGRRVAPVSQWKLLAHACFPAGYYNHNKQSSRRQRITCNGEGCPGTMEIEKQWTKGGYNAFDIVSMVECSVECKYAGKNGTRTALRLVRPDDSSCPICCSNLLRNPWIEFPCGQQACCVCLRRLVESCPAAILRETGVVIFDPTHNAKHCYDCPFCKTPYYPWTKLQLHRRNTNDIVVSSEESVENLVGTPYAYQSFDPTGLPARIATPADLPRVEARYVEFLHEREAERRRQEQAPPTAEEVWEFLLTLSNADHGRLQALRQAGLFVRHPLPVLNFLEAVEALHDRHLDFGFLERVADAHDVNERYQMMLVAYETGWAGEGHFDDRLIVNLLQRKNLLEVIDLVSDNESERSGPLRQE